MSEHGQEDSSFSRRGYVLQVSISHHVCCFPCIGTLVLLATFTKPFSGPSEIFQHIYNIPERSTALVIGHYWSFGSLPFRLHIFRGCKSTGCLFSQPLDLAIRQRVEKAETPYY